RTEFELPVSQTALAQMLAASRSKVNAELRKLERDGIVRLGYRRLFILDFNRMAEVAGPNVLAL
ncbi:MAG: Crp-like helix-turn-helix domain, partial [Ramlibacter sp.]|nr:Crp-like helix-turn-helix domain [Ramlibacter sp.]